MFVFKCRVYGTYKNRSNSLTNIYRNRANSSSSIKNTTSYQSINTISNDNNNQRERKNSLLIQSNPNNIKHTYHKRLHTSLYPTNYYNTNPNT